MSGESRQSRKTELALVLAQGQSVAAWIRKSGVSRRTAYRWASDPKVREWVQAWRRRAADRAVGRMALRATWAADRIVDLGRNAESESVRLKALRAILSDMVSVTHFSTLEERVAEVEELVHERQPTGSADRAG
jgi:hypothetical protein